MNTIDWAIVSFLFGAIAGALIERLLTRQNAYNTARQKYEALETKVNARLNER